MSESRHASHAGTAPERVPLGTTGLKVSRIGFGGYRVDDETPEHRQALEAALASGCTLIDTSTNYTDGGSERLVGAVLRDLAARDRAARDQVVVVSKIGYVQGRNLEVAMEREREGRPFPEMVKYMDGCWHCLHPEFLRDQLTRSRDRLGVERLDVCLLHNPEYYLSDAKRRHHPGPDAARVEFYRRLGESFAFLEERVAAGEIGWYGVSSNNAVIPADDPEATSVTRMIAAAAEGAGPRHHFRVLQIPMNLFESGGALVRNTGEQGRQTALEAAAGAGLGVLINRPLNAFVGGRLVRLASAAIPPQRAGFDELTGFLATLEAEYREQIAARVPPPGPPAAAEELFHLVEQVIGLGDSAEDFSQWQQVEQQYVIPRVNHVVSVMVRALGAGLQEIWKGWWGRYLPALKGLLFEIGRRAAERTQSASAEIAAAIDPGLPPERRSETLSRKALWVLAGTPGVTTVLVGMRRPAYVEDALAIASWPPLADPLAVYGRLVT